MHCSNRAVGHVLGTIQDIGYKGIKHECSVDDCHKEVLEDASIGKFICEQHGLLEEGETRWIVRATPLTFVHPYGDPNGITIVVTYPAVTAMLQNSVEALRATTFDAVKDKLALKKGAQACVFVECSNKTFWGKKFQYV